MGLVERVQRWMRGTEPTLVDYETFEQAAAGSSSDGKAWPEATGGTEQPAAYGVLGRVGLTGGGGAREAAGRNDAGGRRCTRRSSRMMPCCRRSAGACVAHWMVSPAAG